MNYYDEIKEKLIDNEIYGKVKDYSKNRSNLNTYYNVGKLLVEAGKHYGEGIVKEYFKRLIEELRKKYSYRTLNYMIKFYNFQKMQSMTANLSWGHWIQLLSIKDINKVKYYIRQCDKLSLITRQLREKIKSKEYERLPDETKRRLINLKQPKVEDLIKNPIVIKNTGSYELISEKVLQKLILENIENFMKELGNAFCFIGSEYKIKLGDRSNYIDLFLYNIKFKCYVVVELKVIELKKEYIGQVQTYMNYIDKNIKVIDEDKTIGIIIVKRNNRYIMEYCSDERILIREYELV